MKSKQIPSAVVRTLQKAHGSKGMSYRAALAEAINSWPGFVEIHHQRENEHVILLPVQEIISEK